MGVGRDGLHLQGGEKGLIVLLICSGRDKQGGGGVARTHGRGKGRDLGYTPHLFTPTCWALLPLIRLSARSSWLAAMKSALYTPEGKNREKEDW